MATEVVIQESNEESRLEMSEHEKQDYQREIEEIIHEQDNVEYFREQDEWL